MLLWFWAGRSKYSTPSVALQFCPCFHLYLSQIWSCSTCEDPHSCATCWLFEGIAAPQGHCLSNGGSRGGGSGFPGWDVATRNSFPPQPEPFSMGSLTKFPCQPGGGFHLPPVWFCHVLVDKLWHWLCHRFQVGSYQHNIITQKVIEISCFQCVWSMIFSGCLIQALW